MNVLIVGADGKGSFEMRGKQLGHALGARVTITPTHREWRWADVVILVKRAAIKHAASAKRAKVPLVWDVVDFWEQPTENQTPIEVLRQRVFAIRDAIGVTTLIGATKAMAEDIGGVYLPHQCREGLAPEPPRLTDSRRLVVAYEGRKKYLDRWYSPLERACADLGYSFVINPPDLRDADVVVALRGGRSDGEVCRRWKSGVKYVNALVAGRPVVTQKTAGFDEVRPEGLDIEDPANLLGTLRAVAQHHRQAAYDKALERAHEFSLSTVARLYRNILADTLMRAAA